MYLSRTRIRQKSFLHDDLELLDTIHDIQQTPRFPFFQTGTLSTRLRALGHQIPCGDATDVLRLLLVLRTSCCIPRELVGLAVAQVKRTVVIQPMPSF